MKARVGIIGATGYTGVVLCSLLLKHPFCEISYLTSEQYVDRPYYEAYPMFYSMLKEKCKSLNIKEIAKKCNVVFFATPNEFSLNYVPKLLNENNDLKIIDLSADFRLEKRLKLKNRKTFNISYGLPEIYREEIKFSPVIANPGCYPTSIIFALAPALKRKLIDTNTIIIDSKSGVSGAGRKIKQELHFTEINESFSPYNLAGKHRHIGEIENELSKLSKNKIKVVFSPHLLPINRGIISTIYANLKSKKITQKELYKIYLEFYKNEFFVKVLPESIMANTKNVRYTNSCHLSIFKDKRINKLILVSAIDNMVKGASGQAIQNMNIILSLNEKTGLDSLGQIP